LPKTFRSPETICGNRIRTDVAFVCASRKMYLNVGCIGTPFLKVQTLTCQRFKLLLGNWPLLGQFDVFEISMFYFSWEIPFLVVAPANLAAQRLQ
jgi:hypothetical protein